MRRWCFRNHPCARAADAQVCVGRDKDRVQCDKGAESPPGMLLTAVGGGRERGRGSR